MSDREKDKRIEELEAILQEGIDLIRGDAIGVEWKRGCRSFIAHGMAVLGARTPSSDE